LNAGRARFRSPWQPFGPPGCQRQSSTRSGRGAVSGFLGVLLLAQAQAIAPVAPPAVAPTTVRAERVSEPPVIDGRADDAVWRDAMVISQFQQARPTEGAEARFRTEARVAYDPNHLYVLVRAFDPHPD